MITFLAILAIISLCGCDGIEIGDPEPANKVEVNIDNDDMDVDVDVDVDIDELFPRRKRPRRNADVDVNVNVNNKPKGPVLEYCFDGWIQYHCTNVSVNGYGSLICGMWYLREIPQNAPAIIEDCPRCGHRAELDPIYPVYPHPQSAVWSYHKDKGYVTVPRQVTRSYPWTMEEVKNTTVRKPPQEFIVPRVH